MIFSIITAVYNNKEHIECAINSVWSQKGVQIEHIVMDGGSTDGTVEVIERINNPQIKFKSSKDKGIYDALNKGILNATGEIIGILHSDDFYASENVLKKVEDLFLDGADVVYGDLDYVERNNPSQIFRKWRSGIFTPFDLNLGWVAPHPSFFVKRSILGDVGGFDLNFKISADYDFILRVLKKEKIKVAYLPTTIVKMRVGGESNKTFKNKFKGSAEDYLIAKKYFSNPFFTVVCKVLRKIPQLVS